MSLSIGPAFTIPGYTTMAAPDYDIECDATAYAADGVVGHPAFWLHYLGLDFVEERPGRPARLVASVEGHGFTSAMTWAELLAAAALADERLTWAQRLIRMLPMLGPQELPEDASDVMHRTMDGIGATHRAALVGGPARRHGLAYSLAGT
ncbi:hypothetical protein [Micromonospora zamorensis]|uniref:hypothetical protein n=1 Tax=Micromonospora zamorensis TaxID=709883 RepID=UPI003CEC8FDB